MGFIQKAPGMNFIRKITGVQGQIDATNANADAQVAATKQSAQDAQNQMQAAAQAAAAQAAQVSARDAAEQKAADAASAPLGNADVELQATDPTQTVTQRSRARQASFGRNYGGGVSI